jgi:hypothetical protein
VEAITKWELNISTRIHLSSAGDSTAFNVRMVLSNLATNQPMPYKQLTAKAQDDLGEF